MAYNSSGYLLRAKKIQEIDKAHYEPYHDSCHKMVWQRHIYPIYGYSYRTFLRYLKVKEQPKNDGQLSLF